MKRLRHGHNLRNQPKSLTYNSWQAMKDRCNRASSVNYKHYGGKGIGYDPLWEDFENLLADMGERPSKQHTLERIDRTKGYCKENCYWATYAEQQRNTSRTRMFTLGGRTQCLKDWAKDAKLSYNMVQHRVVDLGWSLEDALLIPSQKAKRKAA